MIQIGIAGKPNVGKSSFLKALTLIDVKVSPIPFTTIKSNVAVGHVMTDCVCREFDVVCAPQTGFCKQGKRFIPVKLIDVGGLIPGSHLGKGIGNAFLDDLRQASVLIQVVDVSGLTDDEGKPTTGYDPAREVEFLEREFDLWFAGIIKKGIKKFERQLRITKGADLVDMLSQQLSGLEISRQHIERALEKVSIDDVSAFARELRRIAKPFLIAANKIDLKPAQANFDRLKSQYPQAVPTSAEAEIALKRAAEQGLIDYLPGGDFKIRDEAQLTDEQLSGLKLIKSLIEKYGSTGVQACLNRAVFDLLGYVPVWPVADVNRLCDKDGRVLPDVFLMPPGSTVKELARVVHTELAEKFICGIDARTKQKLGADKQLSSHDVIEIRFRK
jgi:hypothetical protein